jgi:hypothetical protein
MDIEAEAQQILSQFKRSKRRKSGKRVEQQKEQTPETSKADTMETFDKELSQLYNLPVKINTKSQATMYFALESPKPTDKGGRGVKRKPVPSYISRKWLQQCRFILKHSEWLAIDVLAGSKSIKSALDEIRHSYVPETRAVHEAGHAVIGRVLGLTCGDCSIARTKEHAGISYSQWDDQSRPVRHGRDAKVMTTMAGTEAELELLGKSCAGDGFDVEDIERLLADDAEPAKVEKRLRRMTRMLVRRHRAKIELIAKILVEVNTLSGEHIEEAIATRCNLGN